MVSHLDRTPLMCNGRRIESQTLYAFVTLFKLELCIIYFCVSHVLQIIEIRIIYNVRKNYLSATIIEFVWTT